MICLELSNVDINESVDVDLKYLLFFFIIIVVVIYFIKYVNECIYK